MGLSNFGASVIDKRIGNKAKDRRIETKTKRSTLAGSLRFNKSCPNPTKEKEDELNIENIDLESNEEAIEDDTVLIEEETDINQEVDVGIKPAEDKEEF